jgi:hypothetical protein
MWDTLAAAIKMSIVVNDTIATTSTPEVGSYSQIRTGTSSTVKANDELITTVLVRHEYDVDNTKCDVWGL